MTSLTALDAIQTTSGVGRSVAPDNASGRMVFGLHSWSIATARLRFFDPNLVDTIPRALDRTADLTWA